MGEQDMQTNPRSGDRHAVSRNLRKGELSYTEQELEK